MHIIKRLLPLLFIALSINLFAKGSRINFIDGGWDEAVRLANEQNKPIFMDCYTDWCKPCKRMDEEAFNHSKVAEYYNQHFISIKMDMESEEGLMIRDKYNVHAYPTVLFINVDEELWHRHAGYKYGTPKSLIKVAKRALDPSKRSERYKVEYNNGNKETKFLLQYTKLLNESHQYKPEVFDDYLKSLDTNKLSKKKTRKYIYRYISSTKSFAFKTIIEQGFYPNSLFEQYTILKCLMADARVAGKTTDNNLYQTTINKGYQLIPELQREMHTMITIPYFEQTKQLGTLHDSTVNYVENYLLDSMTGEEYVMQIRDKSTPSPYSKENDEFYSFFYRSDGAGKPKLYQMGYNKTAWSLYEACIPYEETIKDTNDIRDAKIWIEIALTIEEVPQYLNCYAFILHNLGMNKEALNVLNRLKTLIEINPEGGEYEKAMKLRDKLFAEKNK